VCHSDRNWFFFVLDILKWKLKGRSGTLFASKTEFHARKVYVFGRNVNNPVSGQHLVIFEVSASSWWKKVLYECPKVDFSSSLEIEAGGWLKPFRWKFLTKKVLFALFLTQGYLQRGRVKSEGVWSVFFQLKMVAIWMSNSRFVKFAWDWSWRVNGFEPIPMKISGKSSRNTLFLTQGYLQRGRAKSKEYS
jgi:hypothetical protein